LSTVAVALFLTLGATSHGGAAPPAAKGRADRCYVLRANAITNDTDARTRYRRRFSAQDVLDLRFSVWMPGKNDAGLVEIKLYTPAGHLYEVLEATTDAGTARETRYRGRRARVVAGRLPVAGTHITGRSLYGKWRAEVFLDGAPATCTRRPMRFTISP
jgi:hypothetical protein